MHVTSCEISQLILFRTIHKYFDFIYIKYKANGEVTIMRKDKFELLLDDEHYDLIVTSMIEMKNKLTREGRYTDAVDDALIKFLSAKKKYI